jgi:hypothetical protein
MNHGRDKSGPYVSLKNRKEVGTSATNAAEIGKAAINILSLRRIATYLHFQPRASIANGVGNFLLCYLTCL